MHAAFARQTLEQAGSRRCSAQWACCESGSEGRQVERQSSAGNICQRAREVVESFRLEENRRDSCCGLEAECEADGWDESAKEGRLEVCSMKQLLKQGCHVG